jgi:DNA-binding CsgD family transcriptional regulator
VARLDAREGTQGRRFVARGGAQTEASMIDQGLGFGTRIGSSLTFSERAIVELVMRGLSNRDIALARGVSVQTIANQLTIAYRKVGVQSRRELRARWVASAPVLVPFDVVLTPREREILHLVRQGHANKVIAPTVGVAISTVSTLLTRLRRKLSMSPLANGPKTRKESSTTASLPGIVVKPPIGPRSENGHGAFTGPPPRAD